MTKRNIIILKTGQDICQYKYYKVEQIRFYLMITLLLNIQENCVPFIDLDPHL